MKCEGSEGCTREAIYDYHSTKTCFECLYEHIDDYLRSEAIESFIEMEATKLTKKTEKVKVK